MLSASGGILGKQPACTILHIFGRCCIRGPCYSTFYLSFFLSIHLSVYLSISISISTSTSISFSIPTAESETIRVSSQEQPSQQPRTAESATKKIYPGKRPQTVWWGECGKGHSSMRPHIWEHIEAHRWERRWEHRYESTHMRAHRRTHIWEHTHKSTCESK